MGLLYALQRTNPRKTGSACEKVNDSSLNNKVPGMNFQV